MEQESLNVYFEDKKFIVFTLAAISTLSLIGSFLIIFTYVAFKKIRNFAFKLVVYLSVADIILSLGNLFSWVTVQNEDEEFSCMVQAFLVNFGGLASILWTSVIAWSIYSATVLSAKNLREKNIRFFLFGFGLSLIMSLLPFFTNQYGRAGFYCWIKDDLTIKDSVMRFAQFYVPLWIALIFNVYAYVKVIRFIKKYISTTLEVRFIHRLKYYPLVLVFCWTFATINRIYNMFGHEVVFLTFLHVAFGGLQGLLNAIVYGTNDQVKQIWKEKLCCCFTKGYFSMKDEAADTSLKKNEELKQNRENEYNNEDTQVNNREAQEASVEVVSRGDPSDSQQGISVKENKLAVRV